MKFFVIGIDDNQEQFFNNEILNIIHSHSVFSGGARHHEIAQPLLPKNHTWINITIPLNLIFEQYRQFQEIVIFASGDPLFFGFANTIQREIPEAEIILYPSFNSLQLLAHRLLMPYQDMHIVSLTGRPWDKLDEALIMGYDTIGILTDNREHIPSSIAKRMLEYGYDNYNVSIGELLGNKEKERVTTLSLKDVTEREFLAPNCLILRKVYSRCRPFGIPENEFQLLDGRVKMITKMPVRLLTLSLLDLREKAVFWDIGFCTGSISIEAKMQFPHLKILAFEKRQEGQQLIENNSYKFGTPGIQSFIGDFTQMDITGLPKPDAVFIGGHGGKLYEIVTKISEVLNPNGVIVFNSVSSESREIFISAIKKHDLQLDQNIALKVDDFNSIEIMKAKND